LRHSFGKAPFGWRSQPAIARVQEAVAEIRKVKRKDPALAAEGAVLFLEKASPALEQVDSSSGAIGNAVNRAIEALVPIIATAPADLARRSAWLERLGQGYGYKITSADVWTTYSHTMRVVERLGRRDEIRARVRELAADGGFVAEVLGRELKPGEQPGTSKKSKPRAD
jgi:uncharacterized protein (DUF885 family)